MCEALEHYKNNRNCSKNLAMQRIYLDDASEESFDAFSPDPKAVKDMLSSDAFDHVIIVRT